MDSPVKLKVDLFIDDRNLGGLPDWGLIYQMIKERKTFRDIYTQGNIPADQDKKGSGGFRKIPSGPYLTHKSPERHPH